MGILSTICLLIRIKYLKHIHRVPRKLQLHVSQDQKNARDHLFNLYLSAAGQSELYLALHTLLVSLLCHSTSNSKLACPTDYSLCLVSLGDTRDNSLIWKFKKPSDISGKFGQLQYCLRMTYFTHCYTIACNGGIYQPFLPLPLPKAASTESPPPSKTPSDYYSILQEVEKCLEESEDILEVIDSANSQLSGYEEDIEIDDEGDDRNLLQ